MAAGESPQGVILMLLRHFQRLHRLRGVPEQGRSFEDAAPFDPPAAAFQGAGPLRGAHAGLGHRPARSRNRRHLEGGQAGAAVGLSRGDGRRAHDARDRRHGGREAALIALNSHCGRVVLEQPVVAQADLVGLPLAVDVGDSAFGCGKRRVVEATRRFHNAALATPEGAIAYVDREWQPDKVRLRYDWLFEYDATRGCLAL